MELDWITATETNNYGFEIQRKKQNNEFEKIAFVKGYGTTTEKHSYKFTDKNITTGKYQYRLKQVDLNGSFKYSDVVEVNVDVPDKFSLEQNYPNPFNPSTKIKFAVPSNVKRQMSNVSLIVYDILGNEVATLVNKELPSGEYEVEFNAKGLPSGLYFYRLIHK